MKFMLFADMHYHPGVFPCKDEVLDTILRRAEETGCEMIIHAGDFCHGPGKESVRDAVEKYNNFHIPTYHCLGNHDSDGTSFEETVALYKMPSDYYSFDQDGYRFIVTNPNYYRDGDEYVRYSLGNYYKHPETREYMPPEQIAWLAETIETSPFPCILFSHPSFERCDGMKNRQAVLDIIDAANEKKPHSVIMCVNGHHHRDFVRIRKNVIYFDVNSATYDWVEKEHNCYPPEDCEKTKLMNHVVAYNDPLSAVVTLDGLTVTVEGSESTMYRGVTRPMTGNSEFDKAGREVRPEIQSFKITLG